MDRISPEHRSWNMSRIRGRDTAPELVVRSLLHRLGYRFRLHRGDLPGSPDIGERCANPIFPGRALLRQ
jgi:DNA mismatch endonuclease, patch repair protein